MSPWPHPDDKENPEDDGAPTADETGGESSLANDQEEFDDEPEFSLTQLKK